ncbi:Regulatory protein AtoC [Bacteroides uniformis]|nr:Regulatory protein AtoC [Bacteroides uniformis]
MPLVFGKSLYLHTLFFTVISLKTYRIDMSKILIIDDEVQIRTLLTRMMELEGYDVCQAGDCRAALKQLELQNPDVVLCDVFLPDGNGVDLVLAIKKAAPNVEVILLTAHGNIPDGVQAIKNGAFDYITKGDDNNKIIPLISRAVEKARMNVRLEKLEKKVGQTYSFDSILGESKVLKDAVSLAQKVSGTDVPVLLTGETGTGKEVFAQAIHYSSKRARQNFVAVNCSSFSKELLESEMFGHKAGSFTGALKDKKGLFEEANNGTIFLDEIGEMAFELQAKLLRILETGEYIKIGDTKPTRVNVRIIAATNRNLSQEIVAGRFREDLFYRLSVFQIHLPPLRERAGDIRLLAKAFIKSFAEQLARPVVEIAPAFLEALDSQPWKGNIRELRNVIERSMIVCESGYLDIADLPFDIQNVHYEHSNDSSPGSFELSAMERRHIARVLEYTKGNKTEAARLLKIGLTTLYRKIEEYKISDL